MSSGECAVDACRVTFKTAFCLHHYIEAALTMIDERTFPHTLKLSPSSCLHQLVPDASADYFLMEEKIPLSKEKCDAKKVPQQRPLAPDEKVLKVLHSWQPEEGYVGRLCLKAKEEVNESRVQIFVPYYYSVLEQMEE